MSTKPFPRQPSLAHFKHQAKDLLKARQSGRDDALFSIHQHHPRLSKLTESELREAPFLLSDAQLVVAREYGFASWEKLRARAEAVLSFACNPHEVAASASDLGDEFLRLVCLTYGADHPSRREKARQLFGEHPELRGSGVPVAAAMGDATTLADLLQKQPELARKAGGPYRWEPLLYLAYSRFDGTEPWSNPVEAARLLLRHGADPNAGYLWDGNYVFTALTGVFGEGEAGPVNQPRHRDEEALARLLLDAGADPNDSQTLYNRMFTPGTSHLRLLLDCGLGQPHKSPWPDRMGGRLQTPAEMLREQLRWAAQHGHADRAALLLAHGVDPNCQNRNNQTPYELAVLNGNLAIAEILLAHGATRKSLTPLEEFEAACNRADVEVAKSLLESQPKLLSELGDRRVDLLLAAASNNRLAAAHLLLDLGFDVNGMKSRSALHEAAWAGHLEMVKLLIERGADPSIRDASHQATPLDWARYSQRLSVAEFLESFGSQALERPA